MKIIIGAGGIDQPGWLSLERGQLDIRDRAQWARLFAPGSLDAVLSEHVLEHLALADASMAASNVFEFLAPGGYWRIAVPDANNPDPIYHDLCKPGGVERSKYDFWLHVFHGPDEPGHKEFYNLDSITALLSAAQFAVRPLEWFDRKGQFHQSPWNRADGDIRRRMDFTVYLFLVYLSANCWSSSLIVDAIRPSFLEHRQVWRGDPEA